MRCNEFDALIDELLSGVLYPNASQHMRECERCTSHFHARARVQNGLRALATATVAGPTIATDRAVMESYRRWQQRRVAQGPQAVPLTAAPSARVFRLPSRTMGPARTWWSGAAAAAVLFALMGSAAHLWKGIPAGEPTVATAPSAPSGQQIAAANVAGPSANATLFSPRTRPAQGNALRPKPPRSTLASSAVHSEQVEQATLATRDISSRPETSDDEGSNYDSQPVTRMSANAAPVMRLASTGGMSNVAQSASSTWPGYSNLMYCDPVACSGPMQVVHIRVPVGEVRPNLGQTVGNAFVNAEIVVGPDGVARAIRVAN